MAVYLRLEDGNTITLLQSQLKNHVYYADVGIECGTREVTDIWLDEYNHEYVELYQWRKKKGDKASSGNRIDNVLEAEMIDAEDLFKKVLAKVDSGEYPFGRKHLKFRVSDAKAFLTSAREEYAGDSDYPYQIASMPCPEEPETHILIFDLAYSAE